MISKFSVESVANGAAERRGFENVDFAESYIYIMDLEREVEHAHGARHAEQDVVTGHVAALVGHVHDLRGNGELRLMIEERVNTVLIAFEGIRLAAEAVGDRDDELVGKLFLLRERLSLAFGRIGIIGSVVSVIFERIVEEIVDTAFAGIFEPEIAVIVYRFPADVSKFGL